MNDDITNNTYFLREMRALQLVRDLVAIPNAAQGRKTVVWSVGCSTGEEPYGLAMLCREVNCELDILGTDVDGDAIERAQWGTYHARNLRHMAPDRRVRWFTNTGDTVQIAQLLRDQVRFRQHDIMTESTPRHDVDVVLCRNVMTKFSSENAQRAVSTLCSSLRPGGLLILGEAEWLHSDLRVRGTMRLVPMEKSGIIVYQRVDAAPVVASLVESKLASTDVVSTPQAPMSNAWRMVEQLRSLGDTRLDAEQPLEAAACYAKALELAPLLADLHLRLALCRLHTREAKLACESLQRALFLPPQLWQAWVLLVDLACAPSQAHRYLGQVRSLLEATSEIDPPTPRAFSADRAAQLAAARSRRRVLN